jgi:hypothetical protein
MKSRPRFAPRQCPMMLNFGKAAAELPHSIIGWASLRLRRSVSGLAAGGARFAHVLFAEDTAAGLR